MRITQQDCGKGRMWEVLEDGVPVPEEKVYECDTEAGYIKYFVLDSEGEFIVKGNELKRAERRGNFTIREITR